MEAGLTLGVLGVHLSAGLYEQFYQVVVSLPGCQVDCAVSNISLPRLQLLLSGAEEEFPGDGNISNLYGAQQGNVSFLAIIN